LSHKEAKRWKNQREKSDKKSEKSSKKIRNDWDKERKKRWD
jgi:hypothetical protein